MKTKQTKLWQEEDYIPSEPVFVARPGASEEDDGKQFTVKEVHGSEQEPVTNVTQYCTAILILMFDGSIYNPDY